MKSVRDRRKPKLRGVQPSKPHFRNVKEKKLRLKDLPPWKLPGSPKKSKRQSALQLSKPLSLSEKRPKQRSKLKLLRHQSLFKNQPSHRRPISKTS